MQLFAFYTISCFLIKKTIYIYIYIYMYIYIYIYAKALAGTLAKHHMVFETTWTSLVDHVSVRTLLIKVRKPR